MTDHIVTEIADRILTIRINRPDKKNALTFAMYGAMADAIAGADENPDVRAMVITGTDDVFTSGNDLIDFQQNVAHEGESPVHRFLRAITTTSTPLVAAVNGLAIGIGVTMLLHCDFVYAAEDARLQLPFVNLGLVPEAASSLLLPRMAGHQKAAELLMLGQPFDPATGAGIGFVSEVCEAGTALDRAMATAGALASKPPAALRQTKELMRRNSTDVATRMGEEGAVFASQLKSPEVAEAISAFLQKREPDFSQFA